MFDNQTKYGKNRNVRWMGKKTGLNNLRNEFNGKTLKEQLIKDKVVKKKI